MSSSANAVKRTAEGDAPARTEIFGGTTAVTVRVRRVQAFEPRQRGTGPPCFRGLSRETPLENLSLVVCVGGGVVEARVLERDGLPVGGPVSSDEGDYCGVWTSFARFATGGWFDICWGRWSGGGRQWRPGIWTWGRIR